MTGRKRWTSTGGLHLADAKPIKVTRCYLVPCLAVTAVLDGLPDQFAQPPLGQQHPLGRVNLDSGDLPVFFQPGRTGKC